MTKLLAQFLAQNTPKKPRLVLGYDPDSDGDTDQPGAPDPDSDEATLWLYGAIGGWDGIDGEGFAKDISGLKAKTLHVRINSPGGDVFEARAIVTALDAYQGRVVAHVDALAASSASFIMLAADEIRMAPGSFVMIHNPWGFALGDSREMRATADLLDQVRDTIVEDYVARTGMETKALIALMDAETWMDAETALANKFCDAISPRKSKASARAFNLAAYKAPPAALTAPAAPDPAAAIGAELAQARAIAEARLRLYTRAA